MIKKLCGSVTMAVILLLSTVGRAAEPMVITPEIRFTDLTVSVSGTIEGAEASYVTLQMFDMERTIPPIYTGQTKADFGAEGDVVFTFEDFEIPLTSKTGSYIFRLGGNGLQTKEVVVWFTNRLDKRDALEAINAASAQEMTRVMQEQAKNLELDLAEYLMLARTPQILTMVNQSLAALDLTVAEDQSNIIQVEQLLKKSFINLVGAAQLIGGESGISWSQAVEKNKEYLGLDTEGYFRDLPQREKVGEVLKNSGGSSLELTTVQTAFDRAVMVCAVNQYDWGMGEEIFSYYEGKKVVSIDWSVYQRLNSGAKAQIWTNLKLAEMRDADGMITEFESLCRQFETKTDSSAGGGSSRGGGSGSGNGAAYTGDPEQALPDIQLSQTATEFRDLEGVAWARESIEHLVKQGILSGKENGLFYPEDSVTREEFVKMIVCAFKLSDDTARASYEDVSPDEWYYPYVASGVKSGLIMGISPTIFGTGQTISRQDMTVIMARVCDLAQAAQVRSFETFTDEGKIAEYAKDAVKRLSACGVVNGVGDGRFYPEGNATRAEAAKIIYELVKFIGGVEHA